MEVTILSSITHSVKELFVWWAEGLSLLLPGDRNKSIGRSKNFLFIKIDRSELQILNSHNELLLHIEPAIENTNDLLEELFSREASKENLALNVHINKSEVLTRQISLPANTEENLYEVIQYEMDRYTPFDKEDVYFDYRIVERYNDKRLIKVLLIVIKKEILNAVVAAIENSNVHLQSIDIINSEDPDQSLRGVNLLRAKAGINRNNSSSIKWLATAAVGLLILAGVTPFAINYVHIKRLSSELESLEQTVQKVKTLQSEYTKMQDQVGYLVDIKKDNPSIIEMLNLLTQVMPDHTHVQRLSIEDGLIAIQGLSASASELIPVIDQTGIFNDIRFAAPVTQSGGEDLERYSITAQIKSKTKT